MVGVQEYRDDLTLQQALELAINVLSKNMDSTSLTADKCERHLAVFQFEIFFGFTLLCLLLGSKLCNMQWKLPH
jgi:hypothetical protein